MLAGTVSGVRFSNGTGQRASVGDDEQRERNGDENCAGEGDAPPDVMEKEASDAGERIHGMRYKKVRLAALEREVPLTAVELGVQEALVRERQWLLKGHNVAWISDGQRFRLIRFVPF